MSDQTKAITDPLMRDIERIQLRIVSMTDEQRAADRNRQQAECAAFIAKRTKSLLDASALPNRQLGAKELVLDGPWGLTRQNVIARLGKGFLIGLVGIRGNGKTQLAVEAGKAAAEMGRSVRYATATTFFLDIKATYRRESNEDERSVLRKYQRPELLILDEIGNRSENAWENQLLQELINRRYADQTDTILIDNRSAPDFCTAIGPSLSSRMNETGGVIDCAWPSFR